MFKRICVCSILSVLLVSCASLEDMRTYEAADVRAKRAILSNNFPQAIRIWNDAALDIKSQFPSSNYYGYAMMDIATASMAIGDRTTAMSALSKCLAAQYDAQSSPKKTCAQRQADFAAGRFMSREQYVQRVREGYADDLENKRLTDRQRTMEAETYRNIGQTLGGAAQTYGTIRSGAGTYGAGTPSGSGSSLQGSPPARSPAGGKNCARFGVDTPTYWKCVDGKL